MPWGGTHTEHFPCYCNSLYLECILVFMLELWCLLASLFLNLKGVISFANLKYQFEIYMFFTVVSLVPFRGGADQ